MFFGYLREKSRIILVYVLFGIVFLASFCLYHLPPMAVVYPFLLCLLLGLLFLCLDFFRFRKKYETFQMIDSLTDIISGTLPEAAGMEEECYQKIIRSICDEQREQQTMMSRQYEDMIDYYTIWAHQIKTPIASMRLNLQNEDSAFARKLTADLFRIEQYVEMVLMFLRLDSDTTDYCIREYDLDAMIKQAVKKFTGEFINRRLSLEYEPVEAKIVTDEKWLSFVLEQVLSNALKYTPEGCIRIYMEGEKVLCISDTGIGIAPEDLPRIFEKGYTGYNGRGDKKASGIGLYLCKRVCHNLGHKISAESVPDCGTTIRIDLSQKKLERE